MLGVLCIRCTKADIRIRKRLPAYTASDSVLLVLYEPRGLFAFPRAPVPVPLSGLQ
jgi:hypothetical protein